MLNGARESEEVVDIFLGGFGWQARNFYGVSTRTHGLFRGILIRFLNKHKKKEDKDWSQKGNE